MKDKAVKIAFVACVITFLVSAFMLIRDFHEYQVGESEYEEIANNVVIVETVPETVETKAEGTEETVADVKEDIPLLKIDFDTLLATNNEVVGWIDFPGQDISYPILQAEDNDKYLHYTVNGTRNSAGSIFLDYRNEGIALDDLTLIYGHNMKNGSMFGKLKKFRDKAVYDVCPYFDIYVPDGVYRCQIIEVSDFNVNDFGSAKLNFESDEEEEQFLNIVDKASLYDVPDDIDGELVMLFTCTGSNHTYRLTLLGRVIGFYEEAA